MVALLSVCASAFQSNPTLLVNRNKINTQRILSLEPLHAKAIKKGKKNSQASGAKKAPKKSKKNTNSKAEDASATPKKAKPPAKKPKSSAPPWQVLNSKEAKRNIEKEKVRRQRARQGDHSNDAANETQQQQPQILSTAFLSEAQQKFLNWKRFNPVTVPSGMRFVGSYLEKRLPPPLGVPEVAFLGRSNVGKSSLLNRLSAAAAKQRDQARVGKTPGATASVNLYTLMDAKDKEILGWADLPGFGYAKLSKDVKEAVQAAAENYLGKRKELCLGILLVDIRREPSDDDRAVLAALFDLGVPLVVVATKVDKVSKNQLEVCLETVRDGLGLPDGQPLPVSSVTGEGTRDLWKIIIEACEEGVLSKKLKYDEEARKKKEEEAEFDVADDEYFEDDDDFVYSQGYDWVHGDDEFLLEDDENMNEDDYRVSWDEFEDDDFDNSNITPQREDLKALQRRARDMERRGEL